MTALRDKIKTALDEGRTLILGAQVLVGFEFRSVFEPGFEKLGATEQHVRLGGLLLMLLALGLLIAPATYHRIADRGEDAVDLLAFTTRVIELALLPFALGLSVDLYASTRRVLGPNAGLLAGAVTAAVALFFWYGWEVLARSRDRALGGRQVMANHKDPSANSRTTLEDKIEHVLTELRVVLPGAQALLGFQLAIMLLESFDQLPAASKYVHLLSLSLVALSVILLMTPPAYHRIVERGEDTERFHQFASRILLAAVVPLALGMSGDFFVVVNRINHDVVFAVVASVAMLMLFYSLWFALPIYRRRSAR